MSEASTCHQVHWRRPFEPERGVAVIRQWAADQRSPVLVLEARADRRGVRYFVVHGPEGSGSRALLEPLATMTDADSDDRQPIEIATRVKASTRHRPLRSAELVASSAAILSALTTVSGAERLVLQIVLGPRRIPLAVPTQSPSSVVQPWWQTAWFGDRGRVDSEKRAALRAKVAEHGFACTVRLGVAAASKERRAALILGLLAGLRTNETAGLKFSMTPEPASNLNEARTPWRWPLRMGTSEIAACAGWPYGGDELPGQPALHPKPLAPVAAVVGKERIVAVATSPGQSELLCQPVAAALHHTHVIGPTGSGKSVLLNSLIRQDIQAGRSVVVVEPKTLVEDILNHIPASRRDDVVVLDPSDHEPIGLNPLYAPGQRPEVIADRVMGVFKQIHGDIGPRSSDILYASILSLASRPGASLAMLGPLLTNPGFRRSITRDIQDPLTLGPFWHSFEQYSDSELASVLAPVANKIRPLLRPGLRGVIGQIDPRFDLREVFTKRLILLVPLQAGVIGSDSSAILGSLLLSSLWSAAQARVSTSPAQRHPVMLYLDECQRVLHLGTDIGDALAQARGLGLSLTLAHQHLRQLPPDLASAIANNTRSKIAFQLAPEDAAVFAKGHPELEPRDFSELDRFHVYCSLFGAGRSQPYASGRTLPPSKPISDPAAIRAASRARYGRPLQEIEASFAALFDQPTTSTTEQTGRRRRSAL